MFSNPYDYFCGAQKVLYKRRIFEEFKNILATFFNIMKVKEDWVCQVSYAIACDEKTAGAFMREVYQCLIHEQIILLSHSFWSQKISSE